MVCDMDASLFNKSVDLGHLVLDHTIDVASFQNMSDFGNINIPILYYLSWSEF